ncbi:MAG: class I SAM-dependent methyltransferase [Desulfobacterales bacterium]|nr:class I SAM-dependent methyltransferase [Desulfobacterales bacterium]
MSGKKLFDDWTDKYDQWFTTPVGRLVRRYELALVLDFLRPAKGERILDAGCGSGVFTMDILGSGAVVTGLDISLPMLEAFSRKAGEAPFSRIVGNMSDLPFEDDSFDKVISVTALEFIEDGRGAVRELFRVTRPGGRVVAASLNSLSPWAERRKENARTGRSPVFREAVFRSPDDMRALAPGAREIKTAIHFEKTEDPGRAREIERDGQSKNPDTGAFVIARWEKAC